MRSVTLIAPGDPGARTGGHVYNSRIAGGLRERGWSVDFRELDESFPYPTTAALQSAAALLAGLPDGTRLLVDSLALGAMPDAIEREAARLRIAALVHLPRGADVGLEPDTARRLADGERRALAACTVIVVTGAATVGMLARYGITREKIAVVEPGTARARLARGSAAPPVRLLTVGTLNPNKGYDTLLTALAAVRDRDWHLTCAGSLSRHPATVDRVRGLIAALDLEPRVTLAGELDFAALDECYDGADVFVLATRQETYGMAVAEALAHGLPVVSTRTGAIHDLVGADAGLLVPVDDVDALADALARVIGDARLRARLAEGARGAREHMRTWDRAVDGMVAALSRFDMHG